MKYDSVYIKSLLFYSIKITVSNVDSFRFFFSRILVGRSLLGAVNTSTFGILRASHDAVAGSNFSNVLFQVSNKIPNFDSLFVFLVDL